MAIVANDSGGGDFKPVPAGTHFAVCDMVVDLGKQKQSSPMYGDSIRHQVYIRWQIPGERVEFEKDGLKINRSAVIGKFYTLSLGEKANLRKDLQSWRGRSFTAEELRGFDVSKLLGIPATVTITHSERNGKVYANVASVGGIPRGMQAPAVEGQPVLYDEEHQETYGTLSKGLKEKIDNQVREAWRQPAMAGGGVDERNPPPSTSYLDDPLDDDCPF